MIPVSSLSALRKATALSPEIIQLPYNWFSSRNGQAIVAVVVHGTAGRDSRAYLSRGGDLPDGSDRKVSIHALIQKPGDKIYRYVPDERGANHAGFGAMPAPWVGINPNLCTLGVELENLQDGKDPYTDSQLLSLGWWINDARRLHGALRIIRHADIDPTRRKDPVGLTVAAIESWCVKAAAYYVSSTHYKAGPFGAIAQQDRRPDAPAAKYYQPGEPFEGDGELNGYVHDLSGIGFVPIGQVVKL